jgi:hypothetical protein
LRQERKDKEELLEYLKKKVSEVDPMFKERSAEPRKLSGEKEASFVKKFEDPTLANRFHNSVFYQAVIEKGDDPRKNSQRV